MLIDATTADPRMSGHLVCGLLLGRITKGRLSRVLAHRCKVRARRTDLLKPAGAVRCDLDVLGIRLEWVVVSLANRLDGVLEGAAEVRSRAGRCLLDRRRLCPHLTGCDGRAGALVDSLNDECVVVMGIVCLADRAGFGCCGVVAALDADGDVPLATGCLRDHAGIGG